MTFEEFATSLVRLHMEEQDISYEEWLALPRCEYCLFDECCCEEASESAQ